MINTETYGDYPASRDLALILDELNEKQLTRKVGKILHRFFIRSKDIQNCLVYGETLVKESMGRFKKDILNHPNLPDSVKTRMVNIIVARTRETIKIIKDENEASKRTYYTMANFICQKCKR